MVSELVEIKRTHRLLIGTDGGTRARHAFSLGAELGLPIGVLAGLIGVEATSRCTAPTPAPSCSPTPTVRRTIYVTGVDGVVADGELVPRLSAADLASLGPDASPVDPLVLELMGRATHLREIQIVDGLVPGSIAKAMRGEAVGTVVHAG